MQVSRATLQRLNPGADAFMRRVIDAMHQTDLENELQAAMEEPSIPPSHQQPGQSRQSPYPSAADTVTEPAATDDSETDTDDDADDTRAKDVKCSVFVDTHPLPNLQKSVPLPLQGFGSIKYRKNLAYGKVIFARFTRASNFTYPIRGYFFIQVDAEKDVFFRMYGEINKEANVGDYVMPRDVVQFIETKLHMLPKECITVTAAAAGIDPGPGYKFNIPTGNFALLISKTM
jgi:hypothetical protein